MEIRRSGQGGRRKSQVCGVLDARWRSCFKAERMTDQLGQNLPMGQVKVKTRNRQRRAHYIPKLYVFIFKMFPFVSQIAVYFPTHTTSILVQTTTISYFPRSHLISNLSFTQQLRVTFINQSPTPVSKDSCFPMLFR